MRRGLFAALVVVTSCSEVGERSPGSAASEPTTAREPSHPAESSSAGALTERGSDPTSTTKPSQDGTASTSGESPGDSTNETPTAAMRGAVSLHVEPLGDCPLGDTWLDYPVVEGGHPVTATEHGTLSEDNGPGVPGMPLHVTCEWLTMGEPYRLVIGIDAYLGEDRRVASLSPVLDPSMPSTGAFMFSSTDGGPAWGASDSTLRCEYTLIEMDETRQSIWGRITCASLSHQDSTEMCQLTDGYFYFENCRPRML